MRPTQFSMILCFVLNLLSFDADAAAKNKTAAAKSDGVTEISGVNGSNISYAFAMLCDDDSFDKFANWAKRVGFLNAKSNGKIRLTSTKNGMKIDSGVKGELSFKDGKGLFGSFNGVAVKGNDPCELLNAYVDAQKTPKSALLSMLVVTANAQEFREPDKDKDLQDAMSFGALSASTLALATKIKGKVLGLGLKGAVIGLGIYGLYTAFDRFRSNQSKHTFDNIMNTWLSLQCNQAGTFLKTQDYKVVIRKVPPPTSVEVFYVDTDSPVRVTAESEYAKNSRETLINIAKRCNNAKEAEDLMKEYTLLRDRSTGRVASIEEGTPKQPGEAPASEPSAPQSAPAGRVPQSEETK